MAASASDSHPYPIYGARYRVLYPMLDADGDLVTGPTTPDAEISQNCGTFADATNESTEIATASGMFYLDLTATEMQNSSVAILAKSATAGMKTTPIVLYPVRLPIIRTGTAQAGGTNSITLDSGASAIDDYYIGCYVNVTNNSPSNALGQARRITGYVGSTKAATVEGSYGTNPSSASTFEILATAEWTWAQADMRAAGGVAITASGGRPEVNATQFAGQTITAAAGVTLPSSVASPTNITAGTITTVTNLTNAPTAGDLTATMKTSVTTAATAATPVAASVTGAVGSVTGLTAATVHADLDDIQARLPAALVSGRIDASVGAMAANVLTATAINADAITAAKVAADVSAEIADQVWDEVLSGHLSATTTGAALNAAGAAGDPWSTAIPGAYGAGTAGKILGDNVDAAISSRASAAAVSTVQADTDDIQTRLPAALVSGRMDSSMGAISAAGVTAIRALASGTADSGTTTTMVDAARTEADTDYWKGAFILFTSGTIAGQCRLITAFSPGSDSLAFAPPTTQAVSTQTYEILPAARVDLQMWLGVAVGALISGNVPASLVSVAPVSGLASLNDGGTISATASTIRIDNGAAADDYYNGMLIVLIGGTGAGQARLIADYVGSTGVTTITPNWVTTPDATTLYVIRPSGDLSAAQVNAEVVDALNIDTYAEVGQEAPAGTQSIRKMLGYLYKAWRNRSTQTATAYKLYADDATTVDQKATMSDDGTTFDSGEKATGP